MKKVVLIIALLFLSVNSFAGNKVHKNTNEEPTKFTYVTSCGVTAISYSYEDVSIAQLSAWVDAMEEYYCG